jgi:DNA repair exonuclease SbcCD ATPase subunit
VVHYAIRKNMDTFMARTGIYKTDVQRARDSLIATGAYPSVDAVRIALGNTGSKSTIHRYLKELEEEDGGKKDFKTSISEALQDLVERLASRLQEEATMQVDAIRAEQQTMARTHEDAITAARQEIEQLRSQVQRLEQSLSQEQGAHGVTRETLQRENVLRHTAEQHAADLKERLAENETHRQSLEEKHRHAREALEHYRQSVKDQREQDQRRHEQQVQALQAELRQAQQTVVVRQEEVTRLNQEGARLVSDLSHAQKAVYDTQTQLRHIEHKLEALQGVEQRAALLTEQLQERDRQIKSLTERIASAVGQSEAHLDRSRTLEMELVTVQAKHDAQRAIADGLRQVLAGSARMKQPASDKQGAMDE